MGVLGRSFEDMVTNLKKVYDRLLAAGLKLKAKKCHLKKVVYLGHVISEAGIATFLRQDSSNGFITCICVKYKCLRKIWMSQNRGTCNIGSRNSYRSRKEKKL
jgi:hypothetical protein